MASGVVPQIIGHDGALRRRGGLFARLTDFILMVKETSFMYITGPEVIKAVTREEVARKSWAAP